MSLRDRLDAFKAKVMSDAERETIGAMLQADLELRASGIADRALKGVITITAATRSPRNKTGTSTDQGALS